MWANAADFDRSAARAMPSAEQLIAFNGAALAQLRAAAARGSHSLSLVSANSHFRQVVRQHARAYERHPIERPWVSRLLARNLAEYGRAQRILVSSEYIRESFLREGHPEDSLVRFPLTPHPRYAPPAEARETSTFDILFVGSLTVHKGVPLLIDVLRALPQDDIRLVLVGGWGTRAMRRYLEEARERDARISFAPGDPLASMHSARLCVHPAWEDGFGYAPAEALACGLPVIASEDTGMKELIEQGRTGLVTPTGDEAALVEAITAAYRGELF
jgi:glycosyltransferase involved in cell wall biosynthesis